MHINNLLTTFGIGIYEDYEINMKFECEYCGNTITMQTLSSVCSCGQLYKLTMIVPMLGMSISGETLH